MLGGMLLGLEVIGGFCGIIFVLAVLYGHLLRHRRIGRWIERRRWDRDVE